jgi:class 3 adenylate cyclase
MSFVAKLQRAREVLEQQGRLSVRALGRELALAGDELDELIEELVDVQGVAVRGGNVLAWASAGGRGSRRAVGGVEEGSAGASPSQRSPASYTPKHLADKILQSKSALEGERKQVTVLFADVKGSMELAEQLDPEAFSQIMQRFFEIPSEGVERFEGFVDKFTGDGLMALFGAPIAHEDHARRACYAALHLRDEIANYATELRRQHGVGFSTRMGLNSGAVVVGRIGDDLAGSGSDGVVRLSLEHRQFIAPKRAAARKYLEGRPTNFRSRRCCYQPATILLPRSANLG